MEEEHDCNRLPDPVRIKEQFLRCKESDDQQKVDCIQDDKEPEKGQKVLRENPHLQDSWRKEVLLRMEREEECDD